MRADVVALAHGSRKLNIRLRRLAAADVHVAQAVDRGVVGVGIACR
jgi:hypothetical protein